MTTGSRKKNKSNMKDKYKIQILASMILLGFMLSLEGINLAGNWLPKMSFIFIGCVIYTVLQLVFGFMYLLTHKEEVNAKGKVQETLQQAEKNVITEIRPHFIFNTLNAIGAVCLMEPELADRAITQFSEYIRAKFLLMEGEKLISFETELNYIENYINLERLRFGEKIKLVTKTTCTDFLVPIQSIQPFVEDAVKYGISKRSDGGHVTIFTAKYHNKIEIIIEDDGVGKDKTAEIYKTEHFSMSSRIHRLEQFYQIKISRESMLDIGTVVTIDLILPMISYHNLGETT